MIPATGCVEFSLAPSPGQRWWLVASHGAVLFLLVFANTGWPLWLAIGGLVIAHLIWQWRRLDGRRAWRLRIDGEQVALCMGSGAALPAHCRVTYLSRWMLGLRLDTAGTRGDVVLLRDGYDAEQWRRLQRFARETSRTAALRGG